MQDRTLTLASSNFQGLPCSLTWILGLLDPFCGMPNSCPVHAMLLNKSSMQADASGSLEAVKGALLAMPQDRVTLRFLLTGAGPINSGDVQLANASQAQIVSFNQEPSDAVLAQSKRLGASTNASGFPPPQLKAHLCTRPEATTERSHFLLNHQAAFRVGKSNVEGSTSGNLPV